MTEPTIKQRLAGLRDRLSDLEWREADPRAVIGLGVNAAAAAVFGSQRQIKDAKREIAQLEEYERLGYEHEPNF